MIIALILSLGMGVSFRFVERVADQELEIQYGVVNEYHKTNQRFYIYFMKSEFEKAYLHAENQELNAEVVKYRKGKRTKI